MPGGLYTWQMWRIEVRGSPDCHSGRFFGGETVEVFKGFCDEI